MLLHRARLVCASRVRVIWVRASWGARRSGRRVWCSGLLPSIMLLCVLCMSLCASMCSGHQPPANRYVREICVPRGFGVAPVGRAVLARSLCASPPGQAPAHRTKSSGERAFLRTIPPHLRKAGSATSTATTTCPYRSQFTARSRLTIHEPHVPVHVVMEDSCQTRERSLLTLCPWKLIRLTTMSTTCILRRA